MSDAAATLARPLTVDVPGGCTQLNVGRTTFLAMLRSGEIRSIKIGRRTVIPVSELDAYVARKLNAAGQ